MEGEGMPRTGRVLLPNYPHHVVQRGHNRQAVFAAEGDYRRYLDALRELKESLGIRVHAYCLMTNHVHLLLTPGETVSDIGKLMKALAGRATRYRNKQEENKGVSTEWHLLKLFGMPMNLYFLSRKRPWFRE
jgi:putative transposase